MPNIITPALLSALFVGYRNDYQRGIETAATQYKRLATVVPSTSASNTYGWLGQFPSLQKWVGERALKSMAAHGYSIVNDKFEASVGVPRTAIEDDNIGVYSPLMEEMGRAAAVHPDELIFQLLKAGAATLCYDGQNFFDTDHPVFPNVDGTGTAVSVSNYDTGTDPAWYLLDCGRALKPLIFQERIKPELQAMTKTDDEAVFMRDEYRYGVRARDNVGFGFWQSAYCSRKPLTADNFNAAYAAMTSLMADGGRPMAIRPTLLIVPPSLRATALKVVKAENSAGGETNINRDVVEVLDTAWVL